jgi:uncharacterized RDD family membrane protein YckC
MQCYACRVVYSNGLDLCPRCKAPATPTPDASNPETETNPLNEEAAAPANASARETVAQGAQSQPAASAPPVSTLIEFPRAGRASLPQWRKDLSERVREIQERRTRESTREAEVAAHHRVAQPAAETAQPQLGLVPPPPDAPEPNPLVVAALRRIERARQPMPRGRVAGGAAAAVARVAEEQYQLDSQVQLGAALSPAQLTETETAASVKTVEAPVREHGLVVVPPPPKVEPVASLPKSRRSVPLEMTDDEVTLVPESNLDQMPSFMEDIYDDRASKPQRVAACLVDLLVVAFASSPFAAIIELTNGNWTDLRVSASMAGIVLIVMFLYLTASTALAGRTWGMSLLSLRAVDADTGLLPTTRQAVARAIVYMLSLATLGLGILYALFDAEGRTAHDYFSGTAVVRE